LACCGRRLYDGGLEGLRERFGGKRQLLVEFEQDHDEVRVEGAQAIRTADNRATLEFERGAVAASELINRLAQRYRIRDLEVRQPDREATIRRIYKRCAIWQPAWLQDFLNAEERFPLLG
jgi:ABC-2 type transport system ATP-binding protein